MTEKIKARFLAILPSIRALGQWLLLAGLTGLACGLAGAAFTWCVAEATTLRADHPWLLFCMPIAGLLIVFSYRTAGMANDSGTNQIIASVRGETRPPVRLAPLIFLGSVLTHLTGGSAGREGPRYRSAAAFPPGSAVCSGWGTTAPTPSFNAVWRGCSRLCSARLSPPRCLPWRW